MIGKKKTTKAKNKAVVKNTSYDPDKIPAKLFMGFVCLALFIVHLVVTFQPAGGIPLIYRSLVLGLFGKVGYWFWLFCLPYLFWVLVIMRGGKPAMRSFSAIGFVLMCGMSLQLLVPETKYSNFFVGIAELWKGGISGTTAGVICGLLGMLCRSIFGNILSFLVLILLSAFFLLRTMEITIMNLYKAIQDRPREEPKEVVPRDYAAELVRSYYRKRDDKRRRRQEEKDQEDYEYYDDEDVAPVVLPGTRFVKDVVSNLRERRFFDIGDEEDEEDAPALPAPKVGKNRDKVMRSMEAAIDEPPVKETFKADPEPAPAVPEPTPAPAAPKAEKKAKSVPESAAEAVARELDQAAVAVNPPYCFPPINLLKMPQRTGVSGTEEMKENSRRLNETLESFNIAAHIVNVTRGPSVTRYEVELEKGVRLNKLTTCADDIALSLGASGVRIAPVPGKISVVGIEVPNQAVTNVSLREVIDSPEFARAKSRSSIAVGKDIGGSCIIGNIAKFPHMLIAGTTGSGKSVCMNSIIISLLYKASPEDVKLIMVDPKMVELGIYNDIPHLLIPVVTDPKKAAGSLQWAVTEMMRRYKLMSDAGVRDLESFNSIVEAEEEGEKLPQVVIIIDELADLMLVAAKEVEDSICRIAQMGRAAGMHLIIATQRPSSDVITGLMKANIPSRIAFSVASAMESRIILDTQGAEKLVGKGDMLFAPIGTGKPQRVQGCFVTDSEVEAVATYVKNNFKASYDESVMDEIEKTALQTGKKSGPDPEANADEMAGDEMLPQAVDVLFDTKQASVSMLQRRLKLGYARAARIMDEMEEKGIVGPSQGSKPRDILITREQWEALKQQGYPGMLPDADPVDLPF